MPIPFSCPHCGVQTSVDDQYAGQTGPCGSCGQPITVPMAGGVSPAYSPPARSSSGPSIAIIIVAVLGGVFVLGGVLVALLLPVVQARREAARRSQSISSLKQIGQEMHGFSNNLKRIGLAMHNYHDTFNTFPSAVITDEDGHPMRSWRTAILPFVEQQQLHDQYDYKVPWDDPNNQIVTDTRVTLYQCPSDPPSSPCDTNYLMVVGEGTLGGDPNEAVRLSDITDGTSNTILVIEVGGSGIAWGEPRDITVEEAITFITNPAASRFTPIHPGGANVVTADGRVRFISNTIDPGKLRNLLTKDDGNAVAEF